MAPETLSFKQFSEHSIDVAIPPDMLWWGVGIVVLLFALVSIVLLYHWTRYGYGPARVGFMGALYFTGSLILLSGIFVGVTMYLFSV